MTSRIAATFAKAKTENRKVLVGYTMAYDPDLATSRQVVEALVSNGVDILELGMPFSDPMADGIVIQRAAQRGIKAGATIRGVLDMVAEFRKHHPDTPVILMGYYNPLYRYGVHSFVLDAAHAGVDGVIIVDLPPEEEHEFVDPASKAGLELIRLTSPTTNAARAKVVTRHAGGFVYHIAVAGITGGKAADLSSVKESITAIRTATNLPIVIGFGVRSAEQAKQTAALADGVVIGSAFVEYAEKRDVQGLAHFVSETRKALQAA